MLNIFTSSYSRKDVLAVWVRSIRKYLIDSKTINIVSDTDPNISDTKFHYSKSYGLMNPIYVMSQLFDRSTSNMYLEEDFISFSPWSINNFNGDIIMLESQPGRHWPSILFKKKNNNKPKIRTVVPQYELTYGNCPEWLPYSIRQKAIEAKCLVAGNFLHLDKMSSPSKTTPGIMDKKNELLFMIDNYLTEV